MTKKISELVSGSPISSVTGSTHLEVEAGGTSYGATAAQLKDYIESGITSPVINTSVSGTAFQDDDTFASASASKFASSESIKAYVDSYYASGTYTPVDVSAGGLTFTSAVGTYVKIGKLVHLFFAIVYPTTASTANAEIGGFPYTTYTGDSTLGSTGAGMVSYTNQGSALSFSVRAGGPSTLIANSSGTFITNANMSGKSIRGSIVYRTA